MSEGTMVGGGRFENPGLHVIRMAGLWGTCREVTGDRVKEISKGKSWRVFILRNVN